MKKSPDIFAGPTKALTAKECKDINDNPLDFDLFWDLIKIAKPAMDGKAKVIKPKFIKSKTQPIGFPDTPEWHAFIVVLRECLRRFPCKHACGCDGSNSAASVQKANRYLLTQKGARTAERFFVRYFGALHAYGAGVLKEFDTTKKNSRSISFSPAVFFAAAVSPVDRNRRFKTKQFLDNIRWCEQAFKEEEAKRKRRKK